MGVAKLYTQYVGDYIPLDLLVVKVNFMFHVYFLQSEDLNDVERKIHIIQSVISS